MIQAKKRASLMKRRVIASVIGLLAVAVLLIAMVIGLGLWGGPLVSFLKDVASGVTF